MLDAIHGYLLYPSVFNIVKNTYRVMRHFLDGEELEGAGTAQAAGEEAAWLEIPGIA